MVKASSLIFAIYICLIVSIICGAMLYFFSLYGQLNTHYNINEELLLKNQSLVNFAIGSNLDSLQLPDQEPDAEQHLDVKPYGLLQVLVASTISRTDTVSSAHLVGQYTDSPTICLSNSNAPLSYVGDVTINGKLLLPSTFIKPTYFNNKRSALMQNGPIAISDHALPPVKRALKKIFDTPRNPAITLQAARAGDSVCHNTFLHPAKEILIEGRLSNAVIKGNFIIRAKDSIYVDKKNVLEDVILIAPKIIFEQGFSGSVQAFATQKITINDEARLNYPSVVCVFRNTDFEQTEIKIGKHVSIQGSVIMAGNESGSSDNTTVSIEEGGRIVGDIYCTGKLMLKSNLYGSVFTNRFFYQTVSSTYDNLLADVTIDGPKKPKYYVGIPLFENDRSRHGLLKKVL